MADHQSPPAQQSSQAAQPERTAATVFGRSVVRPAFGTGRRGRRRGGLFG